MHHPLAGRIGFASFILAACPGLPVFGEPAAPAPRDRRPNILWIGVDQLRADTPGCYGNRICRTPSIDRLAAQGTRFTNAYTPCCLCSPARASMLTGLFAFRHGMGTNCDLYHALARELPRPEMLLHRRLAALGYRCAFAGKWHMGAQKAATDYGFLGVGPAGYGDITRTEGFQQHLREKGLSYGPVARPIFGNPKGKTLLAGVWDGPVESTPAYYVADYTMELMQNLAREGQPFFIDCQFWGPHSPHLPAREFAGLHDREAILPWTNFPDDLSGKPASVRRFRSDFYRALPSDWSGWREIVGAYYDYTAMIDRQIGRVLDRLDELGLSGNTVVVFESDHGDMTGSHGLFDKGFMYQEAYRIPMIIRWPAGNRAPSTCDELVYNMDIFPTLLDLAGIPDETLDGRSFLALRDGRPLPRPRDAIFLEFHGIRYLVSQRAMVTRDGRKYIFNAADYDEFYDLNRDPGERVNRIDAADDRATVEQLRRRMKALALGVRDPICDDIAKMFGDWETLSGQFEASSAPPPAGK